MMIRTASMPVLTWKGPTLRSDLKDKKVDTKDLPSLPWSHACRSNKSVSDEGEVPLHLSVLMRSQKGKRRGKQVGF